jgi:hypothetical protein
MNGSCGVNCYIISERLSNHLVTCSHTMHVFKPRKKNPPIEDTPPYQNKKKPNRGPRQGGFGLSIPSEAERKWAAPATSDAGGSARADRERHTSPETNARELAGTTASATEAPTKRAKATRREHTASQRQCSGSAAPLCSCQSRSRLADL